jgi:hypothetical protein
VSVLKYRIKNEDGTVGELQSIRVIRGEDGITPHIGDNGNWFIGDTDTGKPSRGENGVAPDESGDVKAELSDEIKFALLDCLKNVAWAVENGMDFYNVLYNLLIKVYFTQTGETLTMYGIQLVSSIAQDGTELVLA